MKIKRDRQAEYDLLISSWNQDNHVQAAASITEQIKDLRTIAGAETLRRNFQAEYDMLMLLANRATKAGDPRLTGGMVRAIDELIEDAEDANEDVQVGQQHMSAPE